MGHRHPRKQVRPRIPEDAELGAAEQLKKEREANLTPTEKKPAITVAYAVQKYYESCEARRLSDNTLRKYRTVKKVLSEFAEKNGITNLAGFGQQQVRDLIGKRKLSALTTLSSTFPSARASTTAMTARWSSGTSTSSRTITRKAARTTSGTGCSR